MHLKSICPFHSAALSGCLVLSLASFCTGSLARCSLLIILLSSQRINGVCVKHASRQQFIPFFFSLS